MIILFLRSTLLYKVVNLYNLTVGLGGFNWTDQPRRRDMYSSIVEVYLLYLIIIWFILYFSCSPDYVGEYCQYKNPCNTGEQKCLNGGTCNVLFSNNQPPTFQVNSSFSIRHLLCLWFWLKFSNVICCVIMNLFYYTVRFWVLQTNISQ